MYAISIDLGNGKKLVADACPVDDYKEIFIGVEDTDGNYQDLAVVREQYTYKENKVVPIHNRYSVCVWEDETSDGCTQLIDIKGMEDEE